MALNVDPAELVSMAGELATMARITGAALPKDWVVPAGADPISAQAVPQLNGHAATVMNGLLGVLNEVHRSAWNVGAAAVDYTRTDDENGRKVAGAGGSEQAVNPVAETPPHTPRFAPEFRFPMVGTEVDPLTFAQQLHSGPGPGHAAQFAQNLRSYLATTHTAATGHIDRTAAGMQHWTPVGSLAAQQLTEHRSWLDQLGSALSELADGIENYSNAFTAAKAKHPTPAEIIAARKELVAAMRSKNEVAMQDALAKFQEQNARSAQTVGEYEISVNSKTPGKSGTNGTAQAGSDGGGQDLQALMQMIPAMMSMMQTGMSTMGQDGQFDSIGDAESGLGEYGDYGDYGVGGYGGNAATPIGDLTSSIGSGAGGGGDSLPSVTVGPMPTVASVASSSPASNPSASNASAMPKAPVIDALGSSPAAATRGVAGAAGMPYMPMTPGMPGAGGGNNERNRVVAWHPDRLMYVDDTPHTEQVIGEKPTIAPAVTPPTPSPAKQAPTQTGGNA